MFRKFALIWAIMILPLVVIMFGCGEDDSGPSGPITGPDDGFSTEWDITIQNSGVVATLQEVFFDPVSGDGWVVGNEGVILHTTDKGETWEQQDSGVSGALLSVHFVAEQPGLPVSEGWAVGDGGTIIYTTDGGASWEIQNSGVVEQLRSVFFGNTSTGWAVGKSGVIVSTRDGGNSWDPQTSGVNLDLEAVHFAPPPPGEVIWDHGWFVGLNATIGVTTDGTKWTKQVPGRNLSDEPLYGVFFANESKGWAVGKLGPMILNSSNGGQVWGSSAAVDAGSNRLYDLFFINADDGWAVGSSGTILHTSDGGVWDGVETEVSKEVTTPLWGVSFVDSSEGWAVGDAGVILHITQAE